MMEPQKRFLVVLYLLLYSCLSTANLNPNVVNGVEKGIGASIKLVQGLDELSQWASKTEQTSKTIQNVLKVFDKLGQLASGLGFVGALLSFIFAVIPKDSPELQFMKVQFSEVNRKLDSITLQISSLGEKMEWAAYASIYSKDENNIKNSWIKLREFIDSASAAQTEEQKTRFAERFTTFYENSGTENSVYNFHRYLTESNPASLNKNLLELVTQKSEGDFKTLVQFTAYFTSLMVTGLQLNLHFYLLKGYDGKLKAKEAVTQLTNVREKIQAVLLECTDSFALWAEKDVQKIGTKPLPDNINLAYNIKKHLDKKFNLYEWTVIVHEKKDKQARTYGNSIQVIAQDKVVIYLLHQEKGFSVNEGIKSGMQHNWNSEGKLCRDIKSRWPVIFQSTAMKHVEFMHEPSDYDYDRTIDNNCVQLKCANRIIHSKRGSIYTDNTTFTVYLKSQKLVENHPCTDVNCNKGECRQIKDTSTGICKCEKMFYGPTCQGSIQDDIDYAAMEMKVIGIAYQPVPDLTSIYYSLKEMKKYADDVANTLRQDIEWTQIFVKYIDVIEKFRYLDKCHALLMNETVSQDQFVSEVDALFTEGNTFLYMLHKFDLMMQGSGFGDKSNILDILRKSLLRKKQWVGDDETLACSESYSERVDYFVRIMFSMEKEAVLGWEKYQLVKKMRENDKDPISIFEGYVTRQWSLFNRNGCGSLKAERLSNAYCEKPYHSTDKQDVPLVCQNGYRPFPENVQCSNGKWSALPVCYTHPERGITTCRSENGATFCTASCSSGWAFPDWQTSETRQCTKQPCPSFTPRRCTTCTSNSACGYSEVCYNGKCVDGCTVFSCGVNARCSTTNHVQHCHCVGSWVTWKGEQPKSEGCRYQELQWVDRSSTDGLPGNAIRYQGNHVCRARGSDGGWHGGWIWYSGVNTCNYGHDWKEKRAYSFQVLVDPCGGNGVHWLSSGLYDDAVEIGQAIPWPWITYQVCGVDSIGIPGLLFNTQKGLMCHYGYHGRGDRDPNFHSLVKKKCV